MKKLLCVLTLAALTSGCSIFGDRVASKVADGIDKYCEEPLQARELYRTLINEELSREGHSVAVTCNGDSID